MKRYLVTEGNDYQWYGATKCKSLTSARRVYTKIGRPEHTQIWQLFDEPGMVPRYAACGYEGVPNGDIREADQFQEALGI